MKNLNKYSALFISLNLLFLTCTASADTININNNAAPQAPAAPAESAAPTPCNTANQQASSNALPEGTYRYQNRDGSGEQVYTTGEKKPYLVDGGNGCANAQAPIVQPFIEYGPQPGPRR